MTWLAASRLHRWPGAAEVVAAGVCLRTRETHSTVEALGHRQGWQREARPAWAEVLSDFGKVVEGSSERQDVSQRAVWGLRRWRY